MAQLIETRRVAAPLEEAFNYTADFTNIENWDPGVATSKRLDEGDLEVGSTFDVMVLFGSRQSPMTYTITHYEPHHRVVLEGTGKTLTAVDDIRFTTIDGGTEVSYTADLEFKGIMSFAAPFLGSTLDKVGKKALDGLASQLGPLE